MINDLDISIVKTCEPQWPVEEDTIDLFPAYLNKIKSVKICESTVALSLLYNDTINILKMNKYMSN